MKDESEFINHMYEQLGAETILGAIADADKTPLPPDFRKMTASSCVDAMVAIRTYRDIILALNEEFSGGINVELLDKSVRLIIEELTACGTAMDPMQMMVGLARAEKDGVLGG